MKYIIATMALLIIGPRAIASGGSIGLEACTPETANIGEYILSWIYCGVSLESPHDTLFGVLSLYLNAALLCSVAGAAGFGVIKYFWQRMKEPASTGPNGAHMEGAGPAIKIALVFALLTPIISNGFSFIQLGGKKIAATGLFFSDTAVNATSKFIQTDGVTFPVQMPNLAHITAHLVEAAACAEMVRIYHEPDRANGITNNVVNDVVIIQRTANKSNVTLSWDYIDPSAVDTWVYTKSLSKKALCGSVTIALPGIAAYGKEETPQMITGITENVITFDQSRPGAAAYGPIIQDQYVALNTHIRQINLVVQRAFSDLRNAALLSHNRNRESANWNQVESQYRAHTNIKADVLSRLRNAGDELNASHKTFVNNMNAAASKAAARLKTYDDEISICPDTVAGMRDCANAYNFSDQLEKQGTFGLGAYYWTHMKNNRRLMQAQQNLISPEAASIFNNPSESLEGPAVSIDQLLARTDLGGFSYVRMLKLKEGFNSKSADTVKNSKSSYQAVSNEGYATGIEQNTNIGSQTFHQMAGDTVRAVESYLAGDGYTGDIILRLMGLGMALTAIGLMTLTLWAAAWLAASIVGGNIASKIKTLATGININKEGGPVARMVASMFWFALFLILMGVLLGYVLPLVPIIKWSFEIFSWAVLTFVALIYLPIWVAAHAASSDDRFINENTISGYGLSLELLLRPLLLAFSYYGFIALMMVVDIIVTMVSAVSIGMARDVSTAGAFFGYMVAIVVITMMAYQIVIRSFDLISQLTDAVLTRAAFGVRPLGDAVGEQSSGRLAMMFYSRTTKLRDSAIKAILPQRS